ncbi:hypothetical protein [Parendozoicomonas haliclonae]|uniref:Uncharacterized protein n=1 Tax=Parendozoicomonas haliclonae TaxID=1960125 RepID=A0A1X7AJH8_9GAMM|nr:hypothetical protein [Parendozoicomonas haliclonae]SMA45554.1 hypothetical protein EHSB41UT_01948 [Parendozoicomonas haliclonae]
MGTETQNLQKTIKDDLKRLRWSQKRLARELYVATYDYDDDEEMGRYEERVKKDLQRPTTSPQRLNEYLRVIHQHNEYQNLCQFVPAYFSTGALSEALEAEMRDISREIGEELAAAEESD